MAADSEGCQQNGEFNDEKQHRGKASKAPPVTTIHSTAHLGTMYVWGAVHGGPWVFLKVSRWEVLQRTHYVGNQLSWVSENPRGTCLSTHILPRW
jgi:hypothetical protein